MTQAFFVENEVAAMLPDKIFSLKWQTNKTVGGTTELPNKVLSEAEHPRNPSKLGCSTSWAAEEGKKHVKLS